MTPKEAIGILFSSIQEFERSNNPEYNWCPTCGWNGKKVSSTAVDHLPGCNREEAIELLEKYLDDESPERTVEPTDLIIKFATRKAARHFAGWLCGSGEQQYWDWMSYREEEEDGDITVRRFHYHGKENESLPENDPDRYGKFMCDNTIRTTLGRMKPYEP